MQGFETSPILSSGNSARRPPTPPTGRNFTPTLKARQPRRAYVLRLRVEGTTGSSLFVETSAPVAQASSLSSWNQ